MTLITMLIDGQWDSPLWLLIFVLRIPWQVIEVTLAINYLQPDPSLQFFCWDAL
jgi:hypothetical protein